MVDYAIDDGDFMNNKKEANYFIVKLNGASEKSSSSGNKEKDKKNKDIRVKLSERTESV